MNWREGRPHRVFGVRSRYDDGGRRLLLLLSAIVMSGAAVLAAAGSASAATQAKASRTPSSVVLDAIHSVQQHRTAVVKMSISSAGLPDGSTVGGTGSGQIDFATGAMKVTFAYAGSAKLQGLKLSELAVGGHLYIDPSQNGQSVSTLLPGKEWVANPGNLSGQLSGASSDDPADMLGALAAKGNTVKDLGPSEVGGLATEEYLVTDNPAEALARLNQEHMPASVAEGAKAFINAGPFKVDVWVDHSPDGIRQMAVTLPVPGASDTGATVTVTMAFSALGTPVSIQPPSASTVATYAQFERAAKAVQSPTT